MNNIREKWGNTGAELPQAPEGTSSMEVKKDIQPLNLSTTDIIRDYISDEKVENTIDSMMEYDRRLMGMKVLFNDIYPKEGDAETICLATYDDKHMSKLRVDPRDADFIQAFKGSIGGKAFKDFMEAKEYMEKQITKLQETYPEPSIN